MSTPEPNGTDENHFEIVRRPAPAGLETLVIGMTGYRERGRRPVMQVEAASLVVPLIISFAEPFRIALGREPAENDRFGSFTTGLCAKPALIRSCGSAFCVQVDFTPLGAFRFFGLPMHELSDRMVTLGDLSDAPLRSLRERLGEQRGWDERFALLEVHIRDQIERRQPVSARTAWAYERIVATGGRATVARLAQGVEWSRKHLASRFHDEIGLSPKQVARIARFGRARTMAAAGNANGWADIAAACGYADQAHLAREFREFSGATPSAWLGEAAR